MCTDVEIEGAKRALALKGLHEHNDCIRIAYQWLDAQVKLKNVCNNKIPLKHIIEKWAGRYISQSDVEIAAYMHPEVWGRYPGYNISKRLTEPKRARLERVSQAFTHMQYRERHDRGIYKEAEDEE